MLKSIVSRNCSVEWILIPSYWFYDTVIIRKVKVSLTHTGVCVDPILEREVLMLFVLGTIIFCQNNWLVNKTAFSISTVFLAIIIGLP